MGWYHVQLTGPWVAHHPRGGVFKDELSKASDEDRMVFEEAIVEHDSKAKHEISRDRWREHSAARHERIEIVGGRFSPRGHSVDDVVLW